MSLMEIVGFIVFLGLVYGVWNWMDNETKNKVRSKVGLPTKEHPNK